MDRDRMIEMMRVLRVELVGVNCEIEDWKRRRRNGQREVQWAGACVQGLESRSEGIRGRLSDVERELAVGGEDVGEGRRKKPETG